MRNLLIGLFLLLFSACSTVSLQEKIPTYKTDSVSMRLLSEPCSGAMLALTNKIIRPQFHSLLHRAIADFRYINTRTGEKIWQTLEGCYFFPDAKITQGVEMVYLIFIDEDTYLLPKEKFFSSEDKDNSDEPKEIKGIGTEV